MLIKEWLEAINDVYSAKCTLCSEIFAVCGGGMSQVRSHHKGKKHRLKLESRFKNKANIFAGNASTGDLNGLSHQNQVVKAETLWALHVADKNISFRSCNETVDLFKMMFLDSPIAAAMQLKEKKLHTSYPVVYQNILKRF